MIDFIKTWANQIIVAIIIATIFEMILPNGNNKKYIKMIIGIYVLFTLIQPIAGKITGKEIEIGVNYDKYFDEDILNVSSDNFEENNSKLIKQAYIDNIQKDVQAKIQQKGYKVVSCDINILTSEENYGAIESMVLKIQPLDRNETNKENSIQIEKIEVDISNNEENESKLNVTDKERIDIIEYLAEEYSIDKTNIVID